MKLTGGSSVSSRGDVMSTDSEITRVIGLYTKGAGAGDAASLDEAFHDNAYWFGAIGETNYALSKAEFTGMAVAQPGDTGSLVSRTISVNQVGDSAPVVVEEDNYWGALSFTDTFQLNRISGVWKIVCKSFVHTGGSLPG